MFPCPNSPISIPSRKNTADLPDDDPIDELGTHRDQLPEPPNVPTCEDPAMTENMGDNARPDTDRPIASLSSYSEMPNPQPTSPAMIEYTDSPLQETSSEPSARTIDQSEPSASEEDRDEPTPDDIGDVVVPFALRRPQRNRRRPAHLADYVC
jgi:hypothetical protein